MGHTGAQDAATIFIEFMLQVPHATLAEIKATTQTATQVTTQAIPHIAMNLLCR